MGLKRMSEATQQQMHLNETGLMSILNACERDYVRGMKRKERGDMSRLLINPKTRMIPLRIRVLTSNLPDAVKTQMFHDLGQSITDKYLQWCLKMLKMPLDVYHSPSSRCDDLQRSLHQAKREMDDIIVGQGAAKDEVLKILHQSLTNPKETPMVYPLGL